VSSIIISANGIEFSPSFLLFVNRITQEVKCWMYLCELFGREEEKFIIDSDLNPDLGKFLHR